MNREQQYIISGFAALVIAGLLIIFLLLPPDELVPIQPVGQEITDQPQDGEKDEAELPQDLMRTDGDPLQLSDNVTISRKIASPASPSGGGGGGGGGSRDRTPPTVTGIFSRPPDIDGLYTHPFRVTWVGVDHRSGIAFCDPPEDYSGPDGISLVLDGHCTDRAGNVGTGNVTFSYNSTLFVPSFSYELLLSSNTINAGSDLTGTAKTNNTSITQVVFSWKDPSNSTATSNIRSVTLDNVRIAVDIFTVPNLSGVWTLDAHFQNATGSDVEVLSKNFNVISPAINYVYTLVLDRDTVIMNNPIQATAGTNDTTITEVVFVWSDPQTNIKASHAQAFSSGFAQDSFIPDKLGEWKVDARFNNDTDDDIAIKSKFFIVVPDLGGNHPPVAVDDTATTLEDIPVTINVVVNDFDPDGNSFSILSPTQAGNGSVTDNHDGTLTYTPKANYNGQDSFKYRITDSSLASSNFGTVTITINPVNDPPTADAGIDQTVDEKTLVHLSGAGSSDPDGDTLTFSWKQTGGPSVVLSEVSSVTPSFTAPKVTNDTVLTFELKVADPFGGNSTDSVNIKVLDTDDDDECNGEGHDKDRHRHGEIHRHKQMDEDKHKHGDIHEHKDMGGDHDECNGVGHDDDRGKHRHKDKGNNQHKDDKGTGDNDKPKHNDNSDDKEASEKDSGEQGSGSHDDSASNKNKEGADDKNSPGNDNKDHDSSGGANGGDQGSASGDQGAGHKNKGKDDKGSSSSSGKGSGGHDSSASDKGGKDRDPDHDKNNNWHKHP
jgi:hypothetical protein